MPSLPGVCSGDAQQKTALGHLLASMQQHLPGLSELQRAAPSKSCGHARKGSYAGVASPKAQPCGSAHTAAVCQPNQARVSPSRGGCRACGAAGWAGTLSAMPPRSLGGEWTGAAKGAAAGTGCAAAWQQRWSRSARPPDMLQRHSASAAVLHVHTAHIGQQEQLYDSAGETLF